MNNVFTGAVGPNAELAQAAALQQTGHLEDAERAYLRILQLHPDHAEANYYLATVMEKLGRLDAALPHFGAAVTAEPGRPRFWLTYIAALTRAGQSEFARQVIVQARQHGIDPLAVALDPLDLAGASPDELAALLREFMNTLAVLLDKRQFADAERVAHQMTALMPDVGLGWRALAAVLRQQGQHAAALLPLRKAVALMPDDADAKRELADLTRITAGDNQTVHSVVNRVLSNVSACVTRANSRQYRHLVGGLVASVPVLIPSFNNVTYVRRMVAQLKARGLRNIVIVDNASSDTEMLSYLELIQDEVVVVKLDHNAGPRSIFLSDANYARLPDIFCITDPDLELSKELPDEFLFELIDATESFRTGKAGFALDISQPELMKNMSITDGQRLYTMLEWESQFWQHKIATTEGGDPIYNAPIDTTFAVYNKRYFRRNTHLCGVRFAGRYTCRHLPWYKETGLDPAEEQYYRAHQKWSNYLA